MEFIVKGVRLEQHAFCIKDACSIKDVCAAKACGLYDNNPCAGNAEGSVY